MKTWKLALERGEIRFTVVFGTKGHRPRETIQDAGAGKKVPENALAVAEQRDGRLIDKPSLQQAMDYWRKEIAKTGLTGYLYPAVIPLCMDAGCAPPISGAGIQSQGSAGADLDGFGPRRRARAVCGAGLRATGRGIISCSGAIMKSKRPKG
ncbi:TPA: integrase domain-containing protein [Klebsiella pneumoniae]|uniref:Integrase catalytic domain-containing protein n=1 Tax=Klebsiella pneumoniae TaxID=573 RepID=A0A483MQ89_KLEPN|nr:hypothetical protein [Klebsiella pneumoniae]HDS4942157.1 integrase domain-containing protein [Klebsiella pneumoniae subsp. ozaenae]HDS5720650.1 integrase domain-containing protein [Klebsiella pneumoniae subsp. pneumoniae]EIX9148124.1 integrase domain-containing protein [Klebsiella pneumoniae]EJK8796631.1 integrase domain-containing protein [Klebsiella pneumoniae]